MKPFTSKLAGVAGTAMMVIAMLGFSAVQANAQEASAAGDVSIQSSCEHFWHFADGRTGSTTATDVNIRSGPHNASPSCTIVGQAQPSHSLRFDCYTGGTGGTWSHVFNYTTGVSGWIKDEFLTGYGALKSC
ncbi:hypothetical protein [Glycomyces algeriensis]|uniref:SH3 domain-containing protein n=1 Tax=Glycomyces algeriensis TaxID=256037 RepID=A0A9W6GCF1_9ACTN|nr:hypothetical protein [Glycomyces algeriensis]MDA1365716.1 hypothetical protein [Glycomyces algeriensis]MDR7351404.1 uncharacterized protein YraI [Glycomyces algeriensis]GLI44123.1 hypothetical protein GALLR39Z86_39730 [Glycomyces algeriensis]